jgi:hypothetical protein
VIYHNSTAEILSQRLHFEKHGIGVSSPDIHFIEDGASCYSINLVERREVSFMNQAVNKTKTG